MVDDSFRLKIVWKISYGIATEKGGRWGIFKKEAETKQLDHFDNMTRPSTKTSGSHSQFFCWLKKGDNMVSLYLTVSQ